MNEQQLRALVREAVARHLGSAAPDVGQLTPIGPAATSHPSHAMYLTLVNVGDACLIEPAVPCNHCGYCKSHGH